MAARGKRARLWRIEEPIHEGRQTTDKRQCRQQSVTQLQPQAPQSVMMAALRFAASAAMFRVNKSFVSRRGLPW